MALVESLGRMSEMRFQHERERLDEWGNSEVSLPSPLVHTRRRRENSKRT